MSCSYLVNEISDIENKKYLELGVRDSINFNSVLAKEKTSVDISCPATYKMSTDDFLQSSLQKKNGILFIL